MEAIELVAIIATGLIVRWMLLLDKPVPVCPARVGELLMRAQHAEGEARECHVELASLDARTASAEACVLAAAKLVNRIGYSTGKGYSIDGIVDPSADGAFCVDLATWAMDARDLLAHAEEQPELRTPKPTPPMTKEELRLLGELDAAVQREEEPSP